jgi:hypothetical protein
METEKKDDMAFQDEKFSEKVEKQPVSAGTSASDAAMTRRILLKLDFRYGLQLVLLIPVRRLT